MILVRVVCALLVIAAEFVVSTAVAADSPSFGDNVQLRGNLDNSRLKFTKEKEGHVAFIGGSITEMDGYRPMVSESLKKRFPDTKFTFTNAGISSTCSTTGAFRLASDVLSKGPVDLIFIEFAVNDDQDAQHARRECIRGLEGIVRRCRQFNPNMDIVVTFFVNEGMIKTLHDGGTPLTVESHETVAKHYQFSTINLAKEVATEIKNGTLTWKQYGGVHPAPFGNAICAKMIDELFDRAWHAPLVSDAKSVAHATPQQSIDPLHYGQGRFINPTEAQSKEGWKLEVPDWKAIAGSKRERFTSIPLFVATTVGAEATLEFTGTAVGAYIVAGPDAGVVEVKVDSAPLKEVDTFHRFSRGLHYPRTVMFATDLPPGKHVLTLKIADKSSSGGHAVRIIQFVAN